MKKSRKIFLFWLLFLSTCAKKALPPSPDKFAPGLKEIVSKNRTTIQLLFDEEIREGSFLLFSLSETLKIKATKIKGDKIYLTTEPQKKKRYNLYGAVTDLAGNRRWFKSHFLGSEIKDTIRPEIKEIEFIKSGLTITFNKPMDTSHLSFFVFPVKRERFQIRWSAEWERLSLQLTDTILPSYLSFLIRPTLTDLEGNRLKRGATFQKFFDTLIVTQPQSGKVLLNEKGVEGATVILKDSIVSFALTDTNGEFKLRLKPGVYNVRAIYDADLDGLIDFVSATELEIPTKGPFLKLTPQKEKLKVDDFLLH